jgi:hypothetical protein
VIEQEISEVAKAAKTIGLVRELDQAKANLPFTVQNILNACFSDHMIVTLEPLIVSLTDVGCVVTGLDRAAVVDNGKQTVPVVRNTGQQTKEQLSIYTRTSLV